MSDGQKNQIEIQTVTVDDLLDVLALGLRDFKAAPAYGLFFSGIYAVGGWVLILMLIEFDLPFLVYPLAAGFALIAPFIASGFYVVSSQLEKSEPLSWSIVFGTVKSMFDRDLGWMALVTGFSLFIWMDIAALMSFGFMSFQSYSFTELLGIILTTPVGWAFLIIGNTAGAVIAFGVFSYSVISIPMLFDRDIDFITAMITSVRFVKRNPRVMAIWCFIIATLTTISLLSGLVGLFVTLPLLGHATWHLYRKAIPPG
ncbi:MAG: DUF2189 domain-containing protein [Rhizobiales bacterium]|nr:DUF2189 domain-containing protein [Hyphomicrobiales bacterium]